MKNPSPVDLMIVSGFLGSGKTTLIKHLLSFPPDGLGKIALLVNEVGRIGVDGELLSGQNIDMVELTSGCICCTLKTDFIRAVQEIRERVGPDLLIVEATGVAQPGDLLENLIEPPLKDACRVRSLITVVNAELFEAKSMFGPFYDNQIRFADVLLLNKIDLVTDESPGDLQAQLREMNPTANIHPTTHCKVEASWLFPEKSFGQHAHAQGRHDHAHFHDLGFQSFSFEDEGVIDREKLEVFLQSLPPTLFRLKGWVRFSGKSALLDFSAGRYRIAPIDEPRTTALAFVGRNCNEADILDGLEKCKMG
ncbi:MAG: GTP-binding protein [Deltaproteobacteria bacterium]|nr:GTP-binding protein [Deltaproteobacteria bacterium]